MNTEPRHTLAGGLVMLIVCSLQAHCHKPADPAPSETVPATAALPSATAPSAPSSAVAPAPAPRRACYPPFTTRDDDPKANAALRLLANDSPDDDTGTQHYAERAVFRAPGAAPLTITSERERVPLFLRRYALTKDRHLFLGWTSWGGGEQSDHLWLVERTGASLRIASKLKLSARRRDTFFILHRDGPNIRVGVPLVHDRAGVDEPWVTFDGKEISDKVNPPLPSPAPAGGDLECFYPPMGAESSMRYVPDVPLVWFDLE